MHISIENLSKRFDSGWVFRDLNITIQAGQKVAVTGPNGSGKSTLLNILCGLLSPSLGTVTYVMHEKHIDRDDIYKYISISAAYSELDEELSPRELFTHYSNFKSFRIDSLEKFLELAQLEDARDKPVVYFSSGMKQRLSLALALTMDSPLLFLDEPSSFLDDTRKSWFYELFHAYVEGKTVFLASNDKADLDLCDTSILLMGS
ncbi:MAG: ABC transporter ATP-binding protein [Saprospiraceae bacterium]|jgi:ABC-type multidrug transport system ATPase subunit